METPRDSPTSVLCRPRATPPGDDLQRSLQAADRQYQSALSIVPDLVVRCTGDGTYLAANRAIEFPGIIPTNQIVGRNIRDILPSDVVERLEVANEKVLQTGAPQTVEYRLLTPKGTRHREARIVASGPDEVTALVRDTTFRHEAAAALRDNEWRLRRLAEKVDAVFWVMDAEGRRRTYQSSPPSEPTGTLGGAGETDATWADAIHPDDSSRVHQAYERARRSVAFDDEYRVVRPDGSIGWMHESGFAVQDGSGDATIVGIARDITGRKLAQEALRQSEQRYRSLFEGSQDAVYVTTPGGQVMDCNDATLDLLGYTREEMLRLNVRDSYVDPRDRERLQEIMMRQGAVRDYDVKLRRRDGVEIDCVITSTLWRSKNGEVIGYHGIARDVTWRRRLEREILSAGVREQRRIGQDLHDGLGQRLTGIAFFSRALAERLDVGSQSGKDVSRIADLIDGAISDVRSLARGLHLLALDTGSLAEALGELAAHTEGMFGISCACQVSQGRCRNRCGGRPPSLPYRQRGCNQRRKARAPDPRRDRGRRGGKLGVGGRSR